MLKYLSGKFVKIVVKDHKSPVGILLWGWLAFPGLPGDVPYLERSPSLQEGLKLLLVIPTDIESFSLISTGSSALQLVFCPNPEIQAFIAGARSMRSLHRTNRA
jgi:hypothetical protein